MATAHVNARVQKHRDALRAAGLRPIQIWVPDTRRHDFAEECRRQCLVVRNDPQEKEIMDWLEAAADTEGWE
ncbi:MAG: antitoxin MazE family protein [Acidithiobacillus sp.]